MQSGEAPDTIGPLNLDREDTISSESTSSIDRFALQRAESGQDLWAAVEGAQYARMIKTDEPGDDAEASRMQALIDLFSDCAERWEEMSPADHSLALEQIGRRLAELAEIRLHVHWGVVPGHVQSGSGDLVEVPIVVLSIAGDDSPQIEIALPGQIAAG